MSAIVEDGDNPPDSRYVAVLRRLPAAQKSAKGAPAYSRFVNRRIGGHLAAACFLLRLRPNQVTALSATCTFTGIVLIATVPPSIGLGLGIAAALVLGYALDSADGQLARLRGGGDASGEWLDHIVDSAKIASLHLVVLIAGYRFFDIAHPWLLVPLGYSIVASVMFFAMILNEQLRRVHGTNKSAAQDAGPPSVVRSLLVVPTDYGLFCLAFVCYGLSTVFAVLYALLFLANTAFLALAARKWFADMRALAAPALGGPDTSGKG